jgi:hypothetical protein
VQITFPKDLVHKGGVEHRDVHNLYGKLYHQVEMAFATCFRANLLSWPRVPLPQKRSVTIGLCWAHHHTLYATSTLLPPAVQASSQGLAERGVLENGESGDRPFVLSRAFFAGTQTVCWDLYRWVAVILRNCPCQL